MKLWCDDLDVNGTHRLIYLNVPWLVDYLGDMVWPYWRRCITRVDFAILKAHAIPVSPSPLATTWRSDVSLQLLLQCHA